MRIKRSSSGILMYHRLQPFLWRSAPIVIFSVVLLLWEPVPLMNSVPFFESIFPQYGYLYRHQSLTSLNNTADRLSILLSRMNSHRVPNPSTVADVITAHAGGMRIESAKFTEEKVVVVPFLRDNAMFTNNHRITAQCMLQDGGSKESVNMTSFDPISLRFYLNSVGLALLEFVRNAFHEYVNAMVLIVMWLMRNSISIALSLASMKSSATIAMFNFIRRKYSSSNKKCLGDVVVCQDDVAPIIACCHKCGMKLGNGVSTNLPNMFLEEEKRKLSDLADDLARSEKAHVAAEEQRLLQRVATSFPHITSSFRRCLSVPFLTEVPKDDQDLTSTGSINIVSNQNLLLGPTVRKSISDQCLRCNSDNVSDIVENDIKQLAPLVDANLSGSDLMLRVPMGSDDDLWNSYDHSPRFHDGVKDRNDYEEDDGWKTFIHSPRWKDGVYGLEIWPSIS